MSEKVIINTNGQWTLQKNEVTAEYSQNEKSDSHPHVYKLHHDKEHIATVAMAEKGKKPITEIHQPNKIGLIHDKVAQLRAQRAETD